MQRAWAKRPSDFEQTWENANANLEEYSDGKDGVMIGNNEYTSQDTEYDGDETDLEGVELKAFSITWENRKLSKNFRSLKEIRFTQIARKLV